MQCLKYGVTTHLGMISVGSNKLNVACVTKPLFVTKVASPPPTPFSLYTSVSCACTMGDDRSEELEYDYTS